MKSRMDSSSFVSIRSPAPAPRRMYSTPRFDKENYQQPSSASSASSSTSNKSFNKTPSRRLMTPKRSSGAGSSFKSPPGSSKLLRQHFAQLAIASASFPSSRRRRLMDNGPVRILNPNASTSKSSDEDASTSTLSSEHSFFASLYPYPMIHSASQRSECMDPVALTLLAKEELPQQQPPLSWSTDLSHLYGTTDGMVKPIPIMASSSSRHPL